MDLLILVKILNSFQCLLQNCSDLVLVQLHFCYPDQVDHGTRRTIFHHNPQIIVLKVTTVVLHYELTFALFQDVYLPFESC